MISSGILLVVLFSRAVNSFSFGGEGGGGGWLSGMDLSRARFVSAPVCTVRSSD